MFDHDPIAGGARVTIAWAGICSRASCEDAGQRQGWPEEDFGRGTSGLEAYD